MTQLSALPVVLRDISLLTAYERNARTHSPKQIQQIANSITQFGFTNPVLIDGKNRIVAGHGRVAAAKQLGLSEVPTIAIEHLSDEQMRAYMLADNKIAANAGWDHEILAIELEYLSHALDLDISVTGFEMAEIDLLISEVGKDSQHDVIPEVHDAAAVVTQPGDLWQLGEHRLLCGNALEESSYQTLMRDDRAALIFTDPPYNVPVDGHVCGLGSIRHREFAMGVGEMSEVEFTRFLGQVCRHLSVHSRDGSLHYVCMDWRHIYELLAAGRDVYSELKNICVWNKDNAGMGSLYRSKHELVVVFKHGREPHVNNIELGKHGRYRTNVWDYAGVNSLRKGRMEELAMHPTVKPTAMVADAIMDSTRRGDIVLDPFAGSGTTLIAAQKTGRIARCMELDPQYCDVTLRRWQALTRLSAIHSVTGLAFDEYEQGVTHVG